MTLQEVLVNSHAALASRTPTPWHEAERLVGLSLGLSREVLIRVPLQKFIPVRARARLQGFLAQRSQGIPLAYLTGESYFYGRSFAVTPHVLIPRPETEVLVDCALECMGTLPYKGHGPITVVDIGTGSGCVAISFFKELARFTPAPKVKLYATDISKQALAIAMRNAKAHRLVRAITFLHGDLVKPLTHKPHLIMANLPYLTQQQMSENPCLRYEPQGALVAGSDGFEVYRNLLQSLYTLGWQQGIHLLLEIDPAQRQLCQQEVQYVFPHAHVDFVPDLHGLTRVARIAL